jgi:hypothetical protein
LPNSSTRGATIAATMRFATNCSFGERMSSERPSTSKNSSVSRTNSKAPLCVSSKTTAAKLATPST